MATSLTRSLVKLLAKPLDQKTCQRTTLHLLDWIGCSVIGTQQPAGHILVDRSLGLPKGNLSSIGACALASPEDAVFLNGGLGSILEMDDVHRTAILHPGPVVIPAALASAHTTPWRQHSSGRTGSAVTFHLHTTRRHRTGTMSERT